MTLGRKPELHDYIHYLDRSKTKSLLFILTLVICLGFALRPIPAVFEPNDTGRYIDYFASYCAGSGNEVFLYSATSMQIFYAVLSPTCFLGEQAFLFSAAIVVPITLLVLSRLRPGMAYWFLAYIVSVYSIELMTNALRQGLGTALLFIGMAVWRRPLIALPILLGSAVSHSSITIALPFAILLNLLRYGRHRKWIPDALIWKVSKLQMAALATLIACAGFFAISASDYVATSALFYSTIYQEGSNVQFIAFMNAPILATFLTRRILDGVKFSSDEGLLFLYAMAIVIAGLFFVPAIVYRFSMLFVPMQIFLILQNNKTSRSSGVVAFTLFATHTAFFAISSENFILSKLLWG